MAEYSIGLDLGGTNYRAAAIDRNGKLLEKSLRHDQLRGGPRGHRGRDRHGHRDDCATAARGDELAGIGVALPGFIVMEKGLVLTSPNIPSFENFPARDVFQERLKAPVILENDANAAALGEKWMGAGRGRRRPGSAHAGHRHRRRHHLGGRVLHGIPRHGRRDWATSPSTPPGSPAPAATSGASRNTPRPRPSPPWPGS